MKIGRYTEDEILEHLTEGEGRGFLGRSMYDAIFDKIHALITENEQIKKQLEYLRSGEYLNQLKFERNMLENIVQNGEVSKEDKEFIDMTHRNTELLEENQLLKDRINKAIEKIDEDIEDLSKYTDNNFIFPSQVIKSYQFYLDLLKEDNKEKQ